jgi:hypothetical protein
MMVVPRGRTPREKGSCRWPKCSKCAQPKKGHIALFIIRNICMGKTIMLLKVLQAFVTIVLIKSRVMFLLLETFVVIMPSIIITVMWLW